MCFYCSKSMFLTEAPTSCWKKIKQWFLLHCVSILKKIKSPYFNTTCCISSRPEVFWKKGVLKSFTNYPGKHLRQSLFFNKVEKKRPWHRCFPVNFSKFFKNTFFHRTPPVTVSVIAWYRGVIRALGETLCEAKTSIINVWKDPIYAFTIMKH